MKLEAKFCINGQPLPVPEADVVLTVENRQTPDSGADSAGLFHRYGQRAGVRRWEFQFTRLSQQAYAYFEIILPTEGDFVFTYPQPQDLTATATCRAYLAAYSVGLHSLVDGSYRQLRFTVQEC